MTTMIMKEITALPYTEERTKEYLDPLMRMFPNIVQVDGRIIRITAESEDGINSVEARIRNHFHEVNFERARSIVLLTETTAHSFHSGLPKNFKEQLFPHDKKPPISTIERETSTIIRVDFTGFIGIFGAKESILQVIKMLNRIFDTQKLDNTNPIHWSENLKLTDLDEKLEKYKRGEYANTLEAFLDGVPLADDGDEFYDSSEEEAKEQRRKERKKKKTLKQMRRELEANRK